MSQVNTNLEVENCTNTNESIHDTAMTRFEANNTVTNNDIVSIKECTSVCTVCIESPLNPTEFKRFTHKRTIAILFVVNLVNYMDRFTIAGFN